MKHRWSVLYLLLSLSEDPRKPAGRVSHALLPKTINQRVTIKRVADTDCTPGPRPPKVGNYGALFAQALPRDAHSTPFYCTRPQSLALGYAERSAGLSASMGTSGISSLGVYTLNGPTATPQSLLAR